MRIATVLLLALAACVTEPPAEPSPGDDGTLLMGARETVRSPELPDPPPDCCALADSPEFGALCGRPGKCIDFVCEDGTNPGVCCPTEGCQ